MCPSGANVQPDTINLEHPLPLQHAGAHNATLAQRAPHRRPAHPIELRGIHDARFQLAGLASSTRSTMSFHDARGQATAWFRGPGDDDVQIIVGPSRKSRTWQCAPSSKVLAQVGGGNL